MKTNRNERGEIYEAWIMWDEIFNKIKNQLIERGETLSEDFECIVSFKDLDAPLSNLARGINNYGDRKKEERESGLFG